MSTVRELPPSHKLTKLVTKWFREYGNLKPGEFLTVSVTRNFQPIVVTFSESVDCEAKQILDAAMTVRFASIRIMVESWGEPSIVVERMRTDRLIELFKHRNIGKVSLNLFADALRKMGRQYPWMEELANLK